MKYNNYQRNHVIVPGSENALENFLDQDYGNQKRHKRKHCISSHSEDALTWSCFNVLKNLSHESKIKALDEIMEDAYEGETDFSFSSAGQVEIHIGKKYTGVRTGEPTEVDASIETPNKLIFFEAKLFSPLSLADEPKGKPFDQIARKLRVGLDCNEKRTQQREFYFIFLDIAPRKKLYRNDGKASAGRLSHRFYDKWKSAWWFSYYKRGHMGKLTPLRTILDGIDEVEPIETVARRMGWLTWSDLYKSILRGLVLSTGFTAQEPHE
jgi:hypothetical protein